ncbi:MAG: Asd/ArgC dimerization domain-containing protein [Bryobacteraceae bacterium]
MAKEKSKSNTLRIALVGGGTLLGREIEDVVKLRLGQARITPYAANGEGNFDEEDGEAIYREPLDAKAIHDDRVVLSAGTVEGARKAYELVKKSKGKGRQILIDCTGQLDQQPEAVIVSPQTEGTANGSGWLQVVAHPAAAAILRVLRQLAARHGIRSSVITVYQPASELGKKAVFELNQQTGSLLSFKPLEKKVFDAQVAFNLLPVYGEDAAEPLIATEQRIERHLASMLSRQNTPAVPMPSIRVIQAGVFHSYSVSAWVEFESSIDANSIAAALVSPKLEVRSSNEDAATPVDVAGQSEVIVSDIRIDSNNGRAAWMWWVADNLRTTADAAVDLLVPLESTQ